jgi:hypothetical protein
MLGAFDQGSLMLDLLVGVPEFIADMVDVVVYKCEENAE